MFSVLILFCVLLFKHILSSEGVHHVLDELKLNSNSVFSTSVSCRQMRRGRYQGSFKASADGGLRADVSQIKFIASKTTVCRSCLFSVYCLKVRGKRKNFLQKCCNWPYLSKYPIHPNTTDGGSAPFYYKL